MPPKISVVIPTYNRAKHLNEALESVFAQTFADFEVIVVDDGSTDNTKEVISLWKDRVNYIYQENQGAAAARNTGIKSANGEFLAFLDSDDIWLPEKLALQTEAFEKNPQCGMVASDYIVFGEDAYEDTLEGVHAHYDMPQIITPEHLFWANLFATSTVLARKKAIEDAGGFNPTYLASHDYELWLKICAEKPIFYIHKPLARWRAQAESISSRSYFRQKIYAIKAREEFLESNPDWAKARGARARKYIYRLYYKNIIHPLFEEGDSAKARQYLRMARAHRPLHHKTYFHEILSWLPPSAYRVWRRTRGWQAPTIKSIRCPACKRSDYLKYREINGAKFLLSVCGAWVREDFKQNETSAPREIAWTENLHKIIFGHNPKRLLVVSGDSASAKTIPDAEFVHYQTLLGDKAPELLGFDAAVSLVLLEYAVNPNRALARIWQALKSDGLLFQPFELFSANTPPTKNKLWFFSDKESYRDFMRGRRFYAIGSSEIDKEKFILIAQKSLRKETIKW